MGSAEVVVDDVVAVLEAVGAAEEVEVEEGEADQEIGPAKTAVIPTLPGGRPKQLHIAVQCTFASTSHTAFILKPEIHRDVCNKCQTPKPGGGGGGGGGGRGRGGGFGGGRDRDGGGGGDRYGGGGGDRHGGGGGYDRDRNGGGYGGGGGGPDRRGHGGNRDRPY